MAIFFRILDVNGINVHILHQSYRDSERIEKADFLKMLADQLVKPHLDQRATNPHLKDVRTGIKRILAITDEGNESNINERYAKLVTLVPQKRKEKQLTRVMYAIKQFA